eukprot:PITA_16416
MKDHALIGKFLGFWPTEKSLQGWIASKWKPKGQVTLLLGPKGFSTAIFYCLEDKSRIFEGGPYFFNSSGLFPRDWKPRFNPDTEDLSHAPVWIRMYSLLAQYWKEETLKDIGNSIGVFIKVAEETKNRRYTSYARIYVQMHLTKALADSASPSRPSFSQSLKSNPAPSSSTPSSLPLSTELKKPASEADMQPSAMELDAALALSLQDDVPEECQNIPTTMEEDPETVSLEGLDILKLETACK